eukprot:CAMPEP_0202701918 /NCGR_PEP_ID=MMETSP1385-20130828/14951_1 /ASSEMBLY_ACC=CAM_ASM_000861 /TAXON_ID=933848 /ORGANISM="Elphidium margaritaceum" /LENGTH=70 /DNA_ID=CAMNT_0049359435 /DNA_START=1 /DNA_END=209 /DNA_ORIENTATION=-
MLSALEAVLTNANHDQIVLTLTQPIDLLVTGLQHQFEDDEVKEQHQQLELQFAVYLQCQEIAGKLNEYLS